MLLKILCNTSSEPVATMPKAKGGITPPFPMKHVIQYGLRVMERDSETSDMLSVRCQFCIYFGPEDDWKDVTAGHGSIGPN